MQTPRARRGDRFRVRVERVVDGDSLVVARSRRFNPFSMFFKPKPFAVRLYAIDAPELSQKHGQASRAEMEKMARGRFRMDVMSIDPYGRVVGVVYRRRRKKSLNHAIVSSGFAYAFEKYGKLEGVAEAESRARKRRRGMWKNGGAEVRPWEHRRRLSARGNGKRAKRWSFRLKAVAFAALVVALALAWQREAVSQAWRIISDYLADPWELATSIWQFANAALG